MNPILPLQHFVPDAEARVWADGRIYLYGSYDTPGNTAYCSPLLHVFSSADMITWQDHGVSFQAQDAHCGAAGRLYAPDCEFHRGKYCLAYCLSNGAEGIALSDAPGGPFTNAFAVDGADGDAIDPAILVDDDGEVYYFWGQYKLRGARLTPDLHAIDRDTLRTAILTEPDHGFHEGACIRKRNGLYYLVYTDTSRGRATSLGYAVSNAPLGPYERRGIIIDNTGCDPESWNNHGSIAAFNGQWYVFYHRSTHASRYSRRVCVEPIQFDANGDIAEVEMTTQGVRPPLPATEPLSAARACLLSGRSRIQSRGPDEGTPDTREHLGWLHDGDSAAWKYLDFTGTPPRVAVAAGSAGGGGRLHLRLDAVDGPVIASIDIGHTGGWQRWQTVEAPLQQPVTGVHALWATCHGGPGRLFDLDSMRFLDSRQSSRNRP